MANQQQQQQQQWPLKDENNADIILSSDLYWNYVYPYTAVDNRIIINKQTKSTQYYAGRRVEIDAAYLLKYGCKSSVCFAAIGELSYVMDSMGYGLSHDEQMKFQISPDSNNFPEDSIVLGLLRCGRWCWDKHISMIESPSERLRECLKLFRCSDPDEEDQVPEGIPLLFPGGGRVEDVVQHHMLMDPDSINGLVKLDIAMLDSTFNRTFPQTPFGIWVERYMRTAHSEMRVGRYYTFMGDICLSKHILEALFEFGGEHINIDPFFEPLESCLPDAFGDKFYLFTYFEPGMSIVDCLKRYSEVMAEIPNEVELPRELATVKERLHELDWVTAKLDELNEAKKKSKQEIRFGWAGILGVVGQYLWGGRK